MTDTDGGKERINPKAFGFHPMSLRLWHGMALDAWWRSMRGKWKLVSPRRYPLILTITLFSINNLLMKTLQHLIYGRRLARVKIETDPVFIIGHWRSGTTWLHHLLMMDDRHAAPIRSQCFCPEFFLLTQSFIKPLLQRFLPERRPMDNVSMDLDKAEEDEIGICLSGAVSPMQSLMFPDQDPIRVYDPEMMSPQDAAFWRRAWLAFLRRVQFVNPGKRLVLKSPTHTLRIAEILRQFPKAQFIHITRDPYVVFMSNMHTRKAMESVSALQDHLPAQASQEDARIADFVSFHRQFEEQRGLIPTEQMTAVRYEDLRADTGAVLQGIYDALSIGDYAHVRPQIEAMQAKARPYQTNTFEMPDSLRRRLDAEFAAYFALYGYLPMDQRTPANT